MNAKCLEVGLVLVKEVDLLLLVVVGKGRLVVASSLTLAGGGTSDRSGSSAGSSASGSTSSSGSSASGGIGNGSGAGGRLLCDRGGVGGGLGSCCGLSGLRSGGYKLLDDGSG